jgi:hypothetical protein
MEYFSARERKHLEPHLALHDLTEAGRQQHSFCGTDQETRARAAEAPVLGQAIAGHNF